MAMPLRMADDETEALYRRAKNRPYGRGLTDGTPITVRARHAADLRDAYAGENVGIVVVSSSRVMQRVVGSVAVMLARHSPSPSLAAGAYLVQLPRDTNCPSRRPRPDAIRQHGTGNALSLDRCSELNRTAHV
jgi:hypothetical protein